MRQSNFLPEDYLAQRAERRSSTISLTLFIVVMSAVVGAFFVTNRQWSIVKTEQAQINVQYAEAARRIEKLNELEDQKSQLVHKAEITAALVERVPRSILLAELINRMPDAVSLDEFELKSKKAAAPKAAVSNLASVKSLAAAAAEKKNKPAPTKAEAESERRIEVPRYSVIVTIVGIAPTDLHVSQYLTTLNECPLLADVNLKYSKQTDIQGQSMRQFRIEMTLDPGGDAKQFEPLRLSRSLRDPTNSTLELGGFDPSMTEVQFDGNPEEDDK